MTNHPDRSETVELLDQAAGMKSGYFDEDEITFTTETISDFRTARNSYNEPGNLKVDTETTLFVEGAQVRKGDQRVELCVVDLGEIRAVVSY